MEDDESAEVVENESIQVQSPEAVESEAITVPERSEELEVIKEVSDVIRDDPAVNSMLDVVRQTPDIFTEIQPMLARRDEFKSAALPGELHRTFTPLFAGIAMSRRGSELLSLAIDRHTETEAHELWELIKAGQAYTSEVVIGSGVHAAIYNAERMAQDPDDPALTIDGSDTAGGQFAGPEGPVWFLNTRTRPEDPHAPNVPGAKGSLNSLERSVLQQSDISGSAYASQDTLATPTKVNHMLYSKVLNETNVTRVEHNDQESTGRPGKYTVTMKHNETGEEISVTTDRIVFASGLGEPITGFERSDEETRSILAEEAEKLEHGQDAQIMTFEQFAERVGDESDPFPLKPFGWVAVIGPGDGGAVAAEYLLGYGPDTRMSSAQLDRVKELFWIGQSAQTRDEYMQTSRQRYRDLALEFPVDEESGYAHRVTPISGRAYKIERTEDGRIRILHGVKAADGSITPSGDVIVDHVVLATGFKKLTDEICKPVLQGETDDGVEELVMEEDGWAVAKRYKGTEIYKVGPSAELPVSRRDAENSPAMRRGKAIDKTVAVWATAEETAAAARLLSAHKPEDERPPSLTTNETFVIPPIELPVFDANESAPGTQLKVEVAAEEINSLLRYDAVSEDISRLAVGTALHRYTFPKGMDGLRLTSRRITDNPTECAFEISVEPSLPESPEYMKMLSELVSEPMLQAVLVRLTDRAVHSSQTAVLDIPFTSGKVSVGEVEIRVKRR